MKCPCCKQDLKVVPKGWWKCQDGSLQEIKNLSESHKRNIVKLYINAVSGWIITMAVRDIAEQRRKEQESKVSVAYPYDDDIPF